MIENKVVHKYIEEYIRSVQPKLNTDLDRVRLEAEGNNVPIVKPEVASLILTLLAIKKPKKILEVGTAVGFSASLMCKYLAEDGEIVTIERDSGMYEKAIENIKKLKLENKIKVVFGDAVEKMTQLSGKFDVIFIDAAKGQYENFYKNSLSLLAKGGVIIADNVLYKGIVALEKDEIPRRNKTIHKRMRNFIDMVMNNPDFESTLIPVGDGMIISQKVVWEE